MSPRQSKPATPSGTLEIIKEKQTIIKANQEKLYFFARFLAFDGLLASIFGLPTSLLGGLPGDLRSATNFKSSGSIIQSLPAMNAGNRFSFISCTTRTRVMFNRSPASLAPMNLDRSITVAIRSLNHPIFSHLGNSSPERVI